MEKRRKKVCKLICPKVCECSKEEFEEEGELGFERCNHIKPHERISRHSSDNCSLEFGTCKQCVSVTSKAGRNSLRVYITMLMTGVPCD